VVVYKSHKALVKSLPPTNQYPVFLQDRCSSCRPDNRVKALKGKIFYYLFITVYFLFIELETVKCI